MHGSDRFEIKEHQRKLAPAHNAQNYSRLMFSLLNWHYEPLAKRKKEAENR
jgi:hypothetical protein